MLTISKLAKRFKLSRATLLYYEQEGLLKPACRAENGYRYYGEKEISLLEVITNYRSVGIPVTTIKRLLIKTDSSKHEKILRKQFNHLEQEIQQLRLQQQAIINFLQQPDLLEETMLSKQRWCEIMQASGMNDEDMHNWHRQFEKMEPEAHQDFLVSLNIDEAEIARIRDWAKS